jgi:hypothetical protein
VASFNLTGVGPWLERRLLTPVGELLEALADTEAVRLADDCGSHPSVFFRPFGIDVAGCDEPALVSGDLALLEFEFGVLVWCDFHTDA